jgi:transcriptional regulator with XRE-family HTH domain
LIDRQLSFPYKEWVRRKRLAPPPKEYGSLLKAWRKHLGLRGLDLARYFGVAPTTLSRYEHGGIRPSLEQWVALARLADVDLATLFAGPPKPKRVRTHVR